MRKQWIITALLIVLCIAIPVAASEVLPTLEEQVKDILVRLEKVEAYEERIVALEDQVHKLTSNPLEPSTGDVEDVVTMTEIEYSNWLEKEFLRAEARIAELAMRVESNDPNEIFSALFELLDMAFGFYDEHSRIVTTAPAYEQLQSTLSCFMDELEPFRNIQDATVAEAQALMIPMLIALDNDNLFQDCDLEALEAFGEDLFE